MMNSTFRRSSDENSMKLSSEATEQFPSPSDPEATAEYLHLPLEDIKGYSQTLLALLILNQYIVNQGRIPMIDRKQILKVFGPHKQT